MPAYITCRDAHPADQVKIRLAKFCAFIRDIVRILRYIRLLESHRYDRRKKTSDIRTLVQPTAYGLAGYFGVRGLRGIKRGASLDNTLYCRA